MNGSEDQMFVSGIGDPEIGTPDISSSLQKKSFTFEDCILPSENTQRIVLLHCTKIIFHF